jgi:AraC-like DNA-binding protein
MERETMIVYDQYVFPEKSGTVDDLVVFHSGFCSTIPNYSYGCDTRDYYLIHYCINGMGVYKAGDRQYHLSKYDGFLILPNQSIVHTADRYDPWDLCWVAFFGKKAEEYLQLAGFGPDNLIFRYDRDDYLEKRIMDIYDESRSGKNIPTILGQFYLLIGKLIDNHSKSEKNASTTFTHFDDAHNYILRNLHNRISVEELSSYLRLDTSQIYRIFKKHTGLSPSQYITELRMKKACELLTKTDLPVKDVSRWLNFEYQSHFTRQFKAVTGTSPNLYRQARSETENTDPPG